VDHQFLLPKVSGRKSWIFFENDVQGGSYQQPIPQMQISCEFKAKDLEQLNLLPNNLLKKVKFRKPLSVET
jgi:hypothetical protein